MKKEKQIIQNISVLLNQKEHKKVREILDALYLANPTHSEFSQEVANCIINTSVKNNDFEGVNLSQHLFCHVNQKYAIREIEYHLTQKILDEKQYDLIEPCLLAGRINMYQLTEDMMIQSNISLCEYVTRSTQLKFSYDAMEHYLTRLFSTQEGLEIMLLLEEKGQFHFDLAKLKECFKSSIQVNSILGVEYLLKFHARESTEIMNQWIEYMHEFPRGDLDWNFFLHSEADQRAPKFLNQLLRIFKNQFNTGFDEKVATYFLTSFAARRDMVEMVDLVEFLELAYEDMEHMPDNTYHYLNHTFKDLSVYWEKKQLEKSVNEEKQIKHKIKI